MRFLPVQSALHRVCHARSPDSELAQRACGQYSTASTEPAYLPTRNTAETEFKGFWMLGTPLVTTFSTCNDPSDSAEALFLLQKSVVICQRQVSKRQTGETCRNTSGVPLALTYTKGNCMSATWNRHDFGANRKQVTPRRQEPTAEPPPEHQPCPAVCFLLRTAADNSRPGAGKRDLLPGRLPTALGKAGSDLEHLESRY